MSRIRKATIKDIDATLPLLRQFHCESSFKQFEMDETKVRKLLTQCIQYPNRVCFISEASEIDGLIAGYCAEFLFSKKKGAWDLAFYVRPERRGGLTAYRLISEFRAWAKQVGAHCLCLGAGSGIDPSRTRRFYLGLGMQEIGGIFQWNVDPAPADSGVISRRRKDSAR